MTWSENITKEFVIKQITECPYTPLLKKQRFLKTRFEIEDSNWLKDIYKTFLESVEIIKNDSIKNDDYLINTEKSIKNNKQNEL